MGYFFKKLFFWIYIYVHSIFINIGIVLRNVEIDILKANPDDLDEKNKKNIRKLHHNPLLEKFYAGQTDQKYVKDYYELLKKADDFMKKSTKEKMEISADKWSMNLGRKDKYGRRYDHVGFFDGKHKNLGKTMGEVLEMELQERRTDDDDYKIMNIFNNNPIEVGLSKIDDVVDSEFNAIDLINKSKTYEFPIKVTRKNNVLNKIEQLAEFMHVKKIGFEYRQLEFFIPKKFKTENVVEDTDIFKELTNMDLVYVKDDYGRTVWYNIQEFIKRITYNDTHEVWKFYAIEIENIDLK